MDDGRPVTRHSYDDGMDRWSMAFASPAPALANHVDRYCSYSERTASFAARRELAATHGVLLYALGDPLSLTGADGNSIVLNAGQGFVAGIADATSISQGSGTQTGFQLMLPLDSLARIIGAPVAAIANQVVRLEDLIGDDATALGEDLCRANGDHGRFARMDRFLEQRLAQSVDQPRDAAIVWAMGRLASPDAPHVAELAAQIGWSRKHLAARFRDVTGFSPQRYRLLARFERFAAALAVNPDKGLAELALDAGYYDQAHLTRDVRAFAAMSPGELRACLIPAQGGIRDDWGARTSAVTNVQAGRRNIFIF